MNVKGRLYCVNHSCDHIQLTIKDNLYDIKMNFVFETLLKSCYIDSIRDKRNSVYVTIRARMH